MATSLWPILFFISFLLRGNSGLAFVINNHGVVCRSNSIKGCFTGNARRRSIKQQKHFRSRRGISSDASEGEEAEGTELSESQEENLDMLLNEALFRMSFFMKTDYLLRTENAALRNLFETCVESVYVAESTIPEAGRGLFARKNIPELTIVAFYPVDCLGFKVGSGLCNSMQLASNQDDIIDIEKSSYTLFSLVNRPLCGVDLQKEFDSNGRMFVDMNPKVNNINEGWYCGFINDASTVKFQGDLDYYNISKSAQNVEIIPFSTAPFQVGITTRSVAQGEELFVSYGYNYWANKLVTFDKKIEWIEKPEGIEEQERDIATKLYAVIDEIEEKYKEASWVLSYLFNNMSSQSPPPIVLPQYPNENDNVTGINSIVRNVRKILAK